MRRFVGIDLGTTNSAVAWLDATAPAPTGPERFGIPQVVAAGEVAARPTLPSFLYFPTPDEQASAALALPWAARPEAVAGTFARDHGALVPARQISSAKSWLSNPSIDRRAPLLPWAAEATPRMSPVEASAALLRHLRDAWNHAEAHGDESLRLERQQVVLTVPASFDEEARELTVEAAQGVGLEHLTLLEEPLAAVYAWMAAHAGDLAHALTPGEVLLVCDVGGGTTDFTLVRAAAAEGRGVEFERVAVGDHLLLGGDNVDLALAALVERRLPDTARLTLTQRQALRRQCSAAKERLLAHDGPDALAVTLLGSGRSLVGGALSAEVSRDDVRGLLNEFLPVAGSGERPHRQARHGLRELGLPYESDPAVTRHLAAFLDAAARAAGDAPVAARMLQPHAVLFNGGFFTPPAARERILDTLAAWFGTRPRVLANEAPEAAVALGAAYYAALRQQALRADVPAGSTAPLIRAGSARAYYVGVQSGNAGGQVQAVCVLPRGTQEGTRLELARDFTVTTNEPAAFTLFSSLERGDAVDDLVTLREGEAHRHAPLVTALRYGQRSRKVPLGVRLTIQFTEVGTLELWCESRTTEHRWRLQFNLRQALDPQDGTAGDVTSAAPEVIVGHEALERAAAQLRAVFAGGTDATAIEGLTGVLENVLGHGRQAWPLAAVRRLGDVLLEVAEGRRLGPRHEARWLNLTGFCLRPGFGAPADDWRIGEMRKVYASGLAHPKDTQCQVEWLILWQRVSAGFNTSQQQELASRMIGMLGLGARKAPRLNPQMFRDAWRLLAGLERLDRTQRTKLGDELLPKVRREPQNGALLWAIGRLGARVPLYGPLNSVVAPAVAERWLDVLLQLRQFGSEAAAAVAQVAARTGDPARDIGDEVRTRLIARLEEAGVSAETVRPVREHLPLDSQAGGRLFGEALPEGLRLA